MKSVVLNVIKVYVFTLLFLSLFIGFSASFSRVLGAFETIYTTQRGLLFFHGLVLFFYILFLLIRYFVRVYRKKGTKTMLSRLVYRCLLPLGILIFSVRAIIKNNLQEDFKYQWDYSIENTKAFSNDAYASDTKHRGMSVYRSWSSEAFPIDDMIRSNIEWVALFPYFYQKDESTKTVTTPETVGRWSTRDSVYINDIKTIKGKGLHVMLKPHLWMSEGWRSNITLNSDSEWNTWFASYKKNMLHYALMAETTGVELLCIGTELRTSVDQQPEQWIALIKEIKKVYHGQLTYAANWDSDLAAIEFWDLLDYIGIQAYFPLTKAGNPDLETIKQGWEPHIKTMETVSQTFDKPILFTEVGYRNDAYATVAPWEWGSAFDRLYTKKSDRTQQLAYEALFEKLWNKKWFAGLYPWQWNSGDFPIRNKPSENTIAKWYGKE